MAITIDKLSDAIISELEYYQSGVTEEVKKSVRASAKACVNELKTTSPKDYGNYAMGWRAKIAYEDPSDIRMQIYNKDYYQLTHLLEDGHAKVGGGRVAARPHIQTAADNASTALGKDITIRVGRR